MHPLAARYDAARARRYAKRIHRKPVRSLLELWAVHRALRRTGGSSVLDAPCGTGRIDGLLRRHFARVTGLDAAPAMLNHYLAANPTRYCTVGDLFAPPFPPSSFDWVACHRFFHHLSHDAERAALLTALRTITRRGLVLYVWLDSPWNGRRGSRRQSVEPAHLERLLRAAGLELASVHRCFAAWQLEAIVVARCLNGALSPDAPPTRSVA